MRGSKKKTASFIIKQKKSGGWMVMEKHSHIVMRMFSEQSEAQSLCDRLNNEVEKSKGVKNGL